MAGGQHQTALLLSPTQPLSQGQEHSGPAAQGPAEEASAVGDLQDVVDVD